jgi:hypothetical protein
MCYRYRVVFRSTYCTSVEICGRYHNYVPKSEPTQPSVLCGIFCTLLLENATATKVSASTTSVHVKLRVQDGYTHLWRSALTVVLPTVRVLVFHVHAEVESVRSKCKHAVKLVEQRLRLIHSCEVLGRAGKQWSAALTTRSVPQLCIEQPFMCGSYSAEEWYESAVPSANLTV